MAPFRDALVTWPGTLLVHILNNSVWERSSKFTNCGTKIGLDAVYDVHLVRGNVRASVPLIASCPNCRRTDNAE
jgi:hypothetical protein